MPHGVISINAGRTLGLGFLNLKNRSHLVKSSAAIFSSPITMATSNGAASPYIVVHSLFKDGPRGIFECMKRMHPEVFQLCHFIDCDVPFSDEIIEKFKKADVLLLDTERLPSLMSLLQSAKWVQSTWAGVDGFINHMDPSQLPPKFTLTRFAGIFGTHMAEYVIGHIVAHERRFALLREAQKRSEWVQGEYTRIGYHLLKGRTVAVLGAGDIGTEVGRVCKALNMRVIGLVRKDLPPAQRSSSIDEYKKNEDLPYVLGEADFVVNVLPSTQQTINFLSGDVLSLCKKKPVFINVGRGDVISEDSIIKAIGEGWISHAILDVTNPEPLPKESPLWQMREVTITPHVSAQSHGPEVTEVFMENYKRYINKEPLKYQLDWTAKY
ncbi:uncharacterized protein in proB 3'region-like [Diadema antillarum]|uniref:uncharacterized protein in proB 3'region-like n=1 Tax=Diadema antillarum TaxID=105358 RepID=UPI003A8C7D87